MRGYLIEESLPRPEEKAWIIRTVPIPGMFGRRDQREGNTSRLDMKF